jgi:hypothetical protein
LQQHNADQLAAATERLPMPKWNADPTTLVGADQFRLVHPLSPSSVTGSRAEPTSPVREDEVQAVIEDLVEGLDDPASRFLALWRLLPERLASCRPLYGRLPADTRVPDRVVFSRFLKPKSGSPYERGIV